MVLVTKKLLTLPVHHQKRHGSHHKHTKPYEKAYWPYLPMLAIAGLSLVASVFWTQLSHPSGAVLGASTGITQDALLTKTNQDRVDRNAGSLTIDPQLTQAAQAKAEDMAGSDYWSHTSPNGDTPWSFVGRSGYAYQAIGENLAYGFADSDDVIKGWLNSQEHRFNMLNSAYQNIGFGIVEAENFQNSTNQTIVVAIYGQPSSAMATAPKSLSLSRYSGDLPARHVARLDLFAGNAVPGALTLLVTVVFVAGSLVIFRHTHFIHRSIVYGETFVVRHPFLDIALISLAAAGIVLSRTAGFIH